MKFCTKKNYLIIVCIILLSFSPYVHVVADGQIYSNTCQECVRDLIVQNILKDNCDFFSDGVFTGNNNSYYEFSDIRSSTELKTKALIVTSIEDDIVKKDIYYIQNSKSGHELHSQDVYYPYNNNSIMIHGTAVYVRYYGDIYCIRPIGVTFSYTKSNASYVPYITVSYVAEGYIRTYPGLVAIDTELHSHVITANINNPSPSTIYSATNAYPTNRVMVCDGGLAGQALLFSYSLNGQSITDCVNLLGW